LYEEPGKLPFFYIDRHLIHEGTSPQAFSGLRAKAAKSAAGSHLRSDGPLGSHKDRFLPISTRTPKPNSTHWKKLPRIRVRLFDNEQ